VDDKVLEALKAIAECIRFRDFEVLKLFAPFTPLVRMAGGCVEIRGKDGKVVGVFFEPLPEPSMPVGPGAIAMAELFVQAANLICEKETG
jgi:hypothetical protein